VRRPLRPVEAFYDSLAMLDGSFETVEAYKVLMLRLAAHPERGRLLPDMSVRVMKTEGYGPFMPLRIYYELDDETVHLLKVDTYG
jgi:hypothetical protein